jgi:hypothetical protein
MKIRPFLFSFLLIVILSPERATASDLRNTESVIDPIAAAAWLSEQPSAEHRAVGLLLDFAPRHETLARRPGSKRTVSIDQVQSVLQASTSPAVLTSLARVCQLSDQVEACRSIGLDQAIIDQDQGNLLARAIFLGNEAERWRSAIADHPFASDRMMDIARLIHRALSDYARANGRNGPPAMLSAQALGFGAAVASAAYTPLYDACQAHEPGILSACRQVAQRMINGPSSLTDQSIGTALMKSVAASEQMPEDSEAWESAGARLKEYSTCLTENIDEDFLRQLSAEEYRDWFDLAASQGELAGYERWAELRGVDCSLAQDALKLAGRLTQQES